MNNKEFKVTKVNYKEEIKCPNCNGEKYIKAIVFDKFTDADKELAYLCPQCSGMGKTEGEDKVRFEVSEEDVFGTMENFEDEMTYTIARDNRNNEHEQGIMNLRGEAFVIYDNQNNWFFDTKEEADKFAEEETANL